MSIGINRCVVLHLQFKQDTEIVYQGCVSLIRDTQKQTSFTSMTHNYIVWIKNKHSYIFSVHSVSSAHSVWLYHSTTLPHYHITTLPQYHTTTVPHYHSTTLPLVIILYVENFSLKNQDV